VASLLLIEQSQSGEGRLRLRWSDSGLDHQTQISIGVFIFEQTSRLWQSRVRVLRLGFPRLTRPHSTSEYTASKAKNEITRSMPTSST